jgi:hypothetical protein
MTPLDQWPKFSTYMQAPKPTVPWHYASIQEAHDKMSPWSFFLYALAAYANALIAWVQYMSKSSADAATQAAALHVAGTPIFSQIRSKADALAKLLREERPNQDPYFLERLLHEKRKAILEVHSWDLMIDKEKKILPVLQQLLPFAKTLLDEVYQVKVELSSSKESHREQHVPEATARTTNRDEDKGYAGIFKMAPGALQNQMRGFDTFESFRAHYPKLSEEDSYASNLSKSNEVKTQIAMLQNVLRQLFDNKNESPEMFGSMMFIAGHVH